MPKIALNLSSEQLEALSKMFPDEPVEDVLVRIVNEFLSGRASKPESRADERSLRTLLDILNAYTGKIDELNRRVSQVVEILEGISSRLQNLEEQLRSTVQQPKQVEKREPRKSALDILKEQGVMFESDIASKIKNRDAFFERLKRGGAVVIALAKERVAVDPDFFTRFKDRVAKLSSSSDDILSRELEKSELRLLKALSSSGLAYFDSTRKRWVIEL
ncbi:MAG: hypothetical protein LM571_04575 [Desulfurococcaceae archaeon]|nr:hypothetical protein [Desulfurococcaceae archaeon]